MSNHMITVAELEDKIWVLEEIRVVIRAPQSTMVPDYPYSRKISSTTSGTEWANGRIRPLLGDIDFYVVDGSGVRPHGRTNMGNLRDSY